MMWQDGWGTGSWVLMGLGMLIFWTVIIVGVIWAVRSSGARPASAGTPAQILDARLARGDLTEEDYLRRRDLLARSG